MAFGYSDDDPFTRMDQPPSLMKRSEPMTSRLWPVLLLLFVIVSGCRTYGGYGTEDATLAQIEQANEQFTAALSRAETEAQVLRAAVGRYPALAPVAAGYEETLARHRALIARHEALLEQAAATSGLFAWIMQTRYRTISRIFGGLLAEQQVVYDRYLDAYESVARLVGAPVAWINAVTTSPRSRYYVVPPQYEAIRQTPTVSIRDLLGS
ncbi:MAG: hypothetical protein D6685_08215 [Bacteroidetes bacterium]|nr:MAG: hypothetical protein D6685_08215 [Bacteroidota bacterium]